MQIVLDNITKKFNREWIFNNVRQHINSGDRLAILGSNGSGKSTLLQIVSGYLTPSDGRILWEFQGKKISAAEIYQYITICAPYLQQEEEFTLRENHHFFTQFKKLKNDLTATGFAEKINLPGSIDKPLKYYSSGMRQRVKIGLAVLAESPLLLLDEPTSHLDKEGIGWYQNLLRENAGDRTILVASNSEETETFICDKKLVIQDFKKR